ncbi:TPA: AraC family ligand binding domain-containing protein [Pseudomonas aeruginosa]|nr:AraC family ligand binding domain-containing protein [Pseudomonas aeruginosa]
MTMNGQPAELHRPIPTLARLPRPVYARAESLRAGSWTSRHRHAWVQLSYAISGVLGVHTAEGSFFAPPQRAIWIPAQLEHEVVTSTRAALDSGYDSTSAYIAAFKGLFGFTPGELFRQR